MKRNIHQFINASCSEKDASEEDEEHNQDRHHQLRVLGRVVEVILSRLIDRDLDLAKRESVLLTIPRSRLVFVGEVVAEVRRGWLPIRCLLGRDRSVRRCFPAREEFCRGLGSSCLHTAPVELGNRRARTSEGVKSSIFPSYLVGFLLECQKRRTR
jgi:hypothetical protein